MSFAPAVALAILLSCVCLIRIVEGNAKFTCGFDPVPAIVGSNNANYQAATLSQMDFSICDEIVLFANIKYDVNEKSFYPDTRAGPKLDEIISEFTNDTFYSDKIKLISFSRDMSIGSDSNDNYKIFLTIMADPDFANKALEYAQEHKLKGFVMNYNIEDNEEDKEKFQTFLSTLRDTFNQNDLLVYLAIATEKDSMDDESLKEWLALENCVNVMLLQACFPLKENLENGAVFPIESVYPPEIDRTCVGDECSVDKTYDYLVVKGGLDASRISMQVQLDCFMVSLKEGSPNCVGTSATNDLKGPVWDMTGYTTFDEMCFAKKEQFFGENVITSCSDRSVAAEIATYVVKNGMYGVYINAMNSDDVQQYCDCGESCPVSRTIRAVLDGTGFDADDCLYGNSQVNPLTRLANECCGAPDED